MSDEHLDVLRWQQGMATRRQLERAGLTRRGLERELAAGRLRRIGTGLYACGELPGRRRHLLSGGVLDLGYLADVRAALLALGERSAASRRTAALVWGFDLAVEPPVVEVDVTPSRSRVLLRGVDVRRTRLDAVVGVALAGFAPIRVTTPVETVLDCVLELPVEEAVAVADSALRSGRCTLEELVLAVDRRRAVPGVRKLRRVVSWCDPKSGSVLESLLRVLLVRAGLVPPQSQFVVREAGAFLARVDLCWPADRLLVEADGRRWHDPDDARNRDRWRGNEFTRLGWRVLRFSWAEVVHQPDYVVRTVRDCLAHRAA